MKKILFLFAILFTLQLNAQLIPDKYSAIMEEMWSMNFKEKLKFLDKKFKGNTNDPWYYWFKADVYSMKEDDANARLCYEKAVEVDPKFAAGYGSYARYLVSYANTDFEKAIELSTKAIELDPKEFNYYLDRADAYLQLKQFNKAIADAEYYMEQEDVMIFAGYLMLINCNIEMDDQVKLKELLMSFEVGQIDFMAGPVMASQIGDYYISYNEPERACGAYRVAAENYELLEGELPTELQKKLANCK